jgi:hypothetical protein
VITLFQRSAAKERALTSLTDGKQSPSRKIGMKPELTLLTAGFIGRKEIKFTKLVLLPTPLNSTRAGWVFSSHTLELGKYQHK